MERTTGLEPATYALGRRRASACASSAWSLPGESNPDRLRTREACLPLPLSRHEFRGLESNPHSHRPKRCVLPLNDPGSRAAVRCRAEPPALQERGRSRARRQSAPARTRTGTTLAGTGTSGQRVIPPRAHESRYPGSNRAVRRRSRRPCASAWLPGLGSNQRGHDSESYWERRCPTRKRVRGAGLEPADGDF
jgi:hypothetical protein